MVERESSVMGLAYDNLALLDLKPEVNVKPAAMKKLLVLFDTSASRAAGYEAQVELLQKLLANLAEPRGGDAMDRIITGLSKIAPAA